MTKMKLTGTAEIPCTISVKSIYPSMRNSEKKVADYVLAHPEDVLSLPLLRLADAVGVSEASVIRFCKNIGYSGYSELKLRVAKELGEHVNDEETQTSGLDIFSESALSAVPKIIISRSIRSLEDTLRIFDTAEYERAVRTLLSADRIVLFGVGNSASVADDAMNKFLKIGLLCNVYSDAHLQMMTATSLGKNDAAIGISHSGMTRDTVDALAAAKKAGASTICITNYGTSRITEVSDIRLLTSSPETSFESETMTSRIAQLAVIDMLYVGMIMQDYPGCRNKIDRLNNVLHDKSY